MPRVSPERLDGRAFLRLMLINGLSGAALGLAFVVGVLALDIAGIRSMLAASGEWLVPLSLFLMGSVVTFASVAMGGAIMLIPRDDRREPPDRGHHGLEPVRVRVAVRQRHRAD